MPFTDEQIERNPRGYLWSVGMSAKFRAAKARREKRWEDAERDSRFSAAILDNIDLIVGKLE